MDAVVVDDDADVGVAADVRRPPVLAGVLAEQRRARRERLEVAAADRQRPAQPAALRVGRPGLVEDPAHRFDVQHLLALQPVTVPLPVRTGRAGSWHGEPGALESGYGTAVIPFCPDSGNTAFADHELEIRYGQVADDRLPSVLQGYTTVDGVRMRPTAVVQDLLFGTSLAANPR
jgi:hypothetical protein